MMREWDGTLKGTIRDIIDLREDCDVMKDRDGNLHPIRRFAIKHWRAQGYKTVARVRFIPKVTYTKQKS